MSTVVRIVVVGRTRQLWLVVLLYILTLGIYRRKWLWEVNQEIDGHAGLGFNQRQLFWFLVLPIIGPSLVNWQTAYRMNTYLYTKHKMRYGSTWGLWAATLVPILGNAGFMYWTQDRLNRFWSLEKDNQELAIDIHQGLDRDAQFKAAMKRAQEKSKLAGARASEKPTYSEIRRERAAVRALGGTTPVLPWRRPKIPPPRIVHASCPNCEHVFDAQRDEMNPTPVVCPRCGMTDVIPSVRGEAKETEPVMVPNLKVSCPDCKAVFHITHNLHGPTPISCPSCGREDVLPPPTAA